MAAPNELNESNESSESLQSNPDDTNLSDTDSDTVTDSVIDSESVIEKDIAIDWENGAATAALIGNPSSSFKPITTSDDIQPLVVIDSLSDEIFKAANIDKDNVTDIVQYYCRRYRQKFDKSCPTITEEFAETIPDMIAMLVDQHGECHIDPDRWKHNRQGCNKWYQDMIDRYFDTDFRKGCNYSLQHFFSGNIRILKYHEVGRQPYEYE